MTIVSCPRCSDPVRLPAGASPEAAVQCPLCKDTFELSEVLADLPPALIVLNDPGAEELKLAPPDEPVVITPAADESEAPSFGINASVSPSSAAKPAASGQRARRPAPGAKRRKPKNPVMEVVKIALGGIAGLVIAQLLLWWMPMKDWRRDPFDLGPSISQFVPWIVPQDFRGGDAAATEGGDLTLPAASSGENGLPSGEPGGVSDSGLPIRTFDDPNQNGAGAGSQGGSTKKNGKAPGGNDAAFVPPAEPVEDPFAVPSVAEPVLELPDPAPLTDDPFGIGAVPEEPQPAATDPLGLPDVDMVLPDEADDGLPEVTLDPTLLMDLEPTPAEPDLAPDATAPPARAEIAGAPKIDAAELKNTIDAAKSQAEAWKAASEQELDSMRGSTFTVLVALGRSAAFAESLAPSDSDAIRGILGSVLSDPAHVASFQRAGKGWLKLANRTSNGAIVVGTVKSVNQHDNLHETVLELEADNTVSVFSNSPPSAEISSGAKIAVLGAIIENPADRLAGYPGDAPFVIWQAVTIPAATE